MIIKYEERMEYRFFEARIDDKSIQFMVDVETGEFTVHSVEFNRGHSTHTPLLVSTIQGERGL